MIAFAYYLLKLFVCSGLLFFYYHLALRNKLFHQWNRFYLLAAIVISISIPCLEFNIWSDTTDSSEIRLLQVIYSADAYVANASAGRVELSFDQWIAIVYSLISASVLGIFILALIKIYSIIRSHPVISIDDIKFVNTEEKSAPFSFLNYVFWNKQIDLKSASGEHIFQHEVVHVREKHSVDKLFLQLVLAVFWCNPFFWLMQKELRMIHEFIADKKSVGQSDARAFATMILHAAYPQHYTYLTNQFFQSSIKRRLTMLTKTHNTKISYISRVLALPVFAFITLAFTIKVQSEQKITKKFLVTTTAKKLSADSKSETNKTMVIAPDTSKPTKIRLVTKNLDSSSSDNALLIIDGVEKGRMKDFKTFMPAGPEIERIDVFTGEAAIKIYGTNGKNGVIVITTRKKGPNSHESINEINVSQNENVTQTDNQNQNIIVQKIANANTETNNNVIFEKVEEEAEFPGGKEAWRRYLERNLNPQVAADKGAPPGTYTVIAQFIVHEDGSLSDIKTLTNHGYGMEGEVIRILERGPKWIPAEQNGHKVTSYRRQPVTFVISAQ